MCHAFTIFAYFGFRTDDGIAGVWTAIREFHAAHASGITEFWNRSFQARGVALLTDCAGFSTDFSAAGVVFVARWEFHTAYASGIAEFWNRSFQARGVALLTDCAGLSTGFSAAGIVGLANGSGGFAGTGFIAGLEFQCF